jgi:hypothetical protein
VPAEVEGCEHVWFKQCAIVHFLTGKIPPINIHCRLQAVFGDKYVDVSTIRHWLWQFKQDEVGEARLGRPVTATDEPHQEHFEEMAQESDRII